MAERRPQRSSSRPARLWVVPPGLMTYEEPFEGYRVLDEMRSGAGVTLWEFLRDADLWSTTPPESRGRLFVSGLARRRRERLAALGAVRELRLQLEAIGRALDGRARNPAAQLTQACNVLSRWASDQGLPHTALAFAHSAALATPDEPAPAYAVGLLARRSAEYRRAETWFRRTLGLARRTRDWNYYGLACIGLGNLFRQRGDYPSARLWYIKALRVARRRALWDVRPMALHDLFCVTANGGNAEEAEEWARRAFRAYGRRHPRLVALAHDVARFWLEGERYDEALQVFRAVLPHIGRLPDRRLITSNMARAAAGMNDRLTFAAMWAETWRLVDEYDDAEGVAEALVSLALGSVALGDPDRAQLAAGHALKMAIQRHESEQRLAAERVLESLRTVRVGVRRQQVQPPAPEPSNDSADEGLNLVEHLVAALNATFTTDFTDYATDFDE
ncbi:MAG TPA: tetratricopeptide repeat protein [Longimicrobium sp.]|jgi:tetratricopeptide (TPR) repeat protein|nr:tetratricopeptide repeat protein [Longimicrobium sp.]